MTVHPPVYRKRIANQCIGVLNLLVDSTWAVIIAITSIASRPREARRMNKQVGSIVTSRKVK